MILLTLTANLVALATLLVCMVVLAVRGDRAMERGRDALKSGELEE